MFNRETDGQGVHANANSSLVTYRHPRLSRLVVPTDRNVPLFVKASRQCLSMGQRPHFNGGWVASQLQVH